MNEAQSALDWLNSTQRFGIKLGLENIRRLLRALGNPEANLRCIHVAGTNGKGSVCAMMESIFRVDRLRTGLYTSPHLVDLRERFRVDGVLISAAELDEILTHIRALVADWDHAPTFFEVTTAVALEVFRRNQVDIVLLETGMGGRLDATNAVTPILSVITPIGMDHQQWLGDTLAKIAFEKAGIIKPRIPVVSAPQHADADAVVQAAAECANSLLIVSQPLDASIPIALTGEHQRINAGLAVAAVEACGLNISERAIRLGLATVDWPGRLQQIGNFWLDGAHNPEGIQALINAWKGSHPGEKPLIIFGAMADKNVRQMLDLLSEIAGEFWFVPIRNDRAAAPLDLAVNFDRTYRIWDSLPDALAEAQRSSRPAIIAGSLFLLGDTMQALNVTPFESAVVKSS